MVVSSFLWVCTGWFLLICLLLILQPGFVRWFSCILLFRLLSVACGGSRDWLVVIVGCFGMLLALGVSAWVGVGWFGLDCSVVALVLQFVGVWFWLVLSSGVIFGWWWVGLFCGVVWFGWGARFAGGLLFV